MTRIFSAFTPAFKAILIGVVGAAVLLGAIWIGNPMDKAFFLLCALGIGLANIANFERFCFLALGGILPLLVTIHLTERGINKTRSHWSQGFVVTATEIVMILLIFMWGKRILFQNAGVRLFPRIALPWLFLTFPALWAASRTIDDPNVSIWMMYQLTLGFTFFLYLINNPRPKKDYIIFAWIIGGTLIFESFLGHMQSMFKTNLGLEFLGASLARVERIKGTIEISRMSGTLVNANLFAGYIAMFMAFPLSLFISRKVHPQKRFLLTLILFAAGMAILGSKSRGTWMSVGLVYSIVIFVVLRTRMHTTRAFLAYSWAIFLLLVGVLSAPGVLERLTATDSGSVDARWYMNHIAMNLIQDNPWTGVGFDNYTYFFNAYDDTEIGHSYQFPFIVHNGYLYTASEYGIPALLLLLLLWYRVFRYTFRWKPRNLEPIELMAWLLPFTFVGRAIQLFFYISNPMCSTPIWFMMGLMVALRELADKEYEGTTA